MTIELHLESKPLQYVLSINKNNMQYIGNQEEIHTAFTIVIQDTDSELLS